MIESRKITTSWPYSTIRLAFSITISDTWMCRLGGSSNVLLITSLLRLLTCRSISVTSSGRSSINRTMTYASGWFLSVALANCESRIVLPARGGETISPR